MRIPLRPALLAVLCPLVAGLGPVAAHAGPAGGGVIATLSARYFSTTVELDPVAGEAAGIIDCASSVPDPGNGASDTVGGGCFNLIPFEGQDLFEITQVTPDGAGDTSSTTSFQGYDLNHDNCVACSANDGDPAWESGGNGTIGAPIPQSDVPLQVFTRLASLHSDGTVRHSITGTIQVQVMTPDLFFQECGFGTAGQGNCGNQFAGATLCAPSTPAGGGCEDLPYPYPGT
ncbi:MAG: hypothetical protein ACYDAY_10635 [Candidatus Dormibacteria bacterium]